MRFRMVRYLVLLTTQQASKTLLASSARVSRVPPMQAPPRLKLPEFSPRDYLSLLLYLAVEIEYALMVQYVFVAYSLKSATCVSDRNHRIGGDFWDVAVRQITVSPEVKRRIHCQSC